MDMETLSEVHCIQSERQALLKIKQDLHRSFTTGLPHGLLVMGNCCPMGLELYASNVTGHVQELHLQKFPPPVA
uniref:Uncharacterized protein n=1 Tax=Fagus sylvatica TaxID=28930 RepID=A0A2N9EWR0_FAGSY